MSVIYSKKENPYLYFILVLLLLVSFIAGAYFVNRYFWYILIPIGFLFKKGLNILKNKEVPVIKLDNEGLTLLKENKENILYSYQEIIEIHMNSNFLNGFIKTKNESSKIHLDSVAIPLTKQKEIVEIVNDRILK